jgi:hypothetical protein
MLNALSVDVEDWFQVGAFEKVIDRDSWDGLESRVERNSDAVLGLFDRAGVKGTFFTLAIARPASRSISARPGPTRSLPRKAIFTLQASLRSGTIIMAGATLPASPSGQWRDRS